MVPEIATLKQTVSRLPIHIGPPSTLFWGVTLAVSVIATAVEGQTAYGILYSLFCGALMGVFAFTSRTATKDTGGARRRAWILRTAAMLGGVMVLACAVQAVSTLSRPGQKLDFLDRGSPLDLLSGVAAVAENPFYYNNLDVRYLAEGERGDAQRAFRRAVELKPDYALAHYNLGKLLPTKDSRKELELALLLSPNNARVLEELSSLYVAGSPEDQQEARYYLGRLIKMDPHQCRTYFLLGSSLEKSGLSVKAAEAYEKALAILDSQQPSDPAARESVARALDRARGVRR